MIVALLANKEKTVKLHGDACSLTTIFLIHLREECILWPWRPLLGERQSP
jgi:hypothetical protein